MYICPNNPEHNTFRSYWERYDFIGRYGAVLDSQEEYDAGVFCSECDEETEAEEV